jgi:hypothetical protein
MYLLITKMIYANNADYGYVVDDDADYDRDVYTI